MKERLVVGILSTVSIVALLVIIASASTEARPNRGILSLPDDAWTTTSKGLSQSRNAVVNGVSQTTDIITKSVSKVSMYWIVGVLCAVSTISLIT